MQQGGSADAATLAARVGGAGFADLGGVGLAGELRDLVAALPVEVDVPRQVPDADVDALEALGADHALDDVHHAVAEPFARGHEHDRRLGGADRVELVEAGEGCGDLAHERLHLAHVALAREVAGRDPELGLEAAVDPTADTVGGEEDGDREPAHVEGAEGLAGIARLLLHGSSPV